MRAVIQRVTRCTVSVESDTVSSIGPGFLILLGVQEGDTGDDLALLVRKCAGLRIFPDDSGKMNRSIRDIGGEALVVSQFTLFGDVRRGLRPYFGDAAAPDDATRLYENFMTALSGEGIPVVGGEFGAHMHVELVNDGPVTIILDTRDMT